MLMHRGQKFNEAPVRSCTEAMSSMRFQILSILSIDTSVKTKKLPLSYVLNKISGASGADKTH